MKKYICLIMAILLIAGLVGCGEAAPAETTAPTETTVPEETVDYSLYMCPWTAEDLAAARSDGKMHYFFMAAEGLHISMNQQNVDKWGDSTLVVFPDGKLMLIDCGPSKYGPVLLRNLQQMGVEHLDYMLVTHPHADHQNGAFDEFNKEGGILDAIGVDKVLWRGAGIGSTEKDLLVSNVCAEKNIPCEVIKQGDVIEIGEVVMTVIWPKEGDTQYLIPAGDINDKSIVHRFDFKEHSALFTADLYIAGEMLMLRETDDELLDVDFLKVPHHGHATSSSDSLLYKTTPELAAAMARVPITPAVRNRYQIMSCELLYDLVDGYIHVTADADGKMEYATTRNDDPAKQDELNIPSASLQPVS